MTPKPDAWTYPIKPSTTQSSVTTIVRPATGDFIFVTEPTDPAGKIWEKKFDRDLGGEIEFSTTASDLGVEGGRIAEGDRLARSQ